MPWRFTLLFALVLSPAFAADGDAARAAIQQVAPMQAVSGFGKSALPGYYEGVIGGQVVYATADGRYVVRGTVEDRVGGTSLTEASMAVKRREVLSRLGDDVRLSYAPPRPRHRITVFTDVDCPYCRRLHAQIATYNDLGIAVDYVFFPLATHIDADKKSAAVWCADDRKRAYDAVMIGQSPQRLSCANPVATTTQAGLDIGISATPSAIAADGTLLTSAVLLSPRRLLAELDKIADRTRSSALAESTNGR